MEKNAERHKLLKKYYSFNSTLVPVSVALLAMFPLFYLMYVPLPEGTSLHLLCFAQTIIFLVIIVTSQINSKLDLILKIYNLDKQGDGEAVDYESKNNHWIIVSAVLITIIVAIHAFNRQMENNRAISDKFYMDLKSEEEQDKALVKEKDDMDKQTK